MASTTEKQLAALKDQLIGVERQGNDTLAAQIRISILMLEKELQRATSSVTTSTTQANDTFVTRESKTLSLVNDTAKKVTEVDEAAKRAQNAALVGIDTAQNKPAQAVTTYVKDTTTGQTSVQKQTTKAADKASQNVADNLSYIDQLLKDDLQTMGEGYDQQIIYMQARINQEVSGVANTVSQSTDKIAADLKTTISTLASKPLSSMEFIAEGIRLGWAGLVGSIKDAFAVWPFTITFGLLDLLRLYQGSLSVDDEQLENALTKQIEVAQKVADRFSKKYLQERFEL